MRPAGAWVRIRLEPPGHLDRDEATIQTACRRAACTRGAADGQHDQPCDHRSRRNCSPAAPTKSCPRNALAYMDSPTWNCIKGEKNMADQQEPYSAFSKTFENIP